MFVSQRALSAARRAHSTPPARRPSSPATITPAKLASPWSTVSVCVSTKIRSRSTQVLPYHVYCASATSDTVKTDYSNGPFVLNFFSNRYKGEGYTTLVIVYDQDVIRKCANYTKMYDKKNEEFLRLECWRLFADCPEHCTACTFDSASATMECDSDSCDSGYVLVDGLCQGKEAPPTAQMSLLSSQATATLPSSLRYLRQQN